MSKKLNLKVTQNPDDKKLLYKEKKKSVFERNFDRKCYCWTHRYRVTNRHSSVSDSGRPRKKIKTKISREEERLASDTGERVWKY